MTSRPLLIPHKRPLHSPNHDKAKENTNNVQKVLNPSAVAAEIRMKKPTPYAHSDDEPTAPELEEKPDPIKVSFAMPPQPFLDPPTWEAMLKRAREARNTSGNGDLSNEASGPSETADQRRQRHDREAEYGSMAIRGRSNISGRGKRPRGRKY